MRPLREQAPRWVGVDELLLGVGLVLLTVALWPVVGLLALAVPGAVITWIAVPARVPFVSRPHDPKKGTD